MRVCLVRFDVSQFVDDLGGAAMAAEACQVSRTTPYRWLKTGRISSEVLARAVRSNPLIDMNKYFKGGDDDISSHQKLGNPI